MLACCSPADSQHDETMNTLRFAQGTRKIVNTVTMDVQEIAQGRETVGVRVRVSVSFRVD
jgi:hypothetical protein